jgi:hypothetical protein
MDRPALQQQLADIAAGRIDTVVVYKSTCSAIDGSHSVRPRNRLRDGCHGGDVDRLDGEDGRQRGLAGRRCGCGVGSVA